MKKTILIVLMVVMVATPCFAQEVETDGLFSIDETRWGYCRITFGFTCNKLTCLLPLVNWECNSIGFYEGTVYSCNDDGSACFNDSNFTYIDSPLVSIVYAVDTQYSEFDILQTSGFGIHTGFGWHSFGSAYVGYSIFGFSIGIMFKVEDNWIPPLA